MGTVDQSPTRFTKLPWRLMAAGPAALVSTLLSMVAFGLYAPIGAVDKIILPVLLFPVIYLGLFFFCMLQQKMNVVALVLSSLLIANVSIIVAMRLL
ncbi:MAG: hypothetical protein AAFR65_08480 [Pseudomonadota bacterium]